MARDRVVVLDVGKTNAKLMLLDIVGGDVVWAEERPSPAIAGPAVDQLDVGGIEAWMLDRLARLPDPARVAAIVPVAHGAAAALLDAAGDVVAVPDYEDRRQEVVAREYAALRDPFSKTFSPDISPGLNIGRQFYYLKTRFPELWARVAGAVPYAQFWAYRLSGVAANNLTTLACHSDLWRPLERRWSDLAVTQRFDTLFPPFRDCGDVLGPLRPEIAAATGLTANVLCGIHDSNASYLCHRVARPDDATLAVLSSGTWSVILARGVDFSRLDEPRDMLANVDAFGEPTATAKFMSGREHAVIAGPNAPEPDGAALARVLAAGATALPRFAPGGPFPGHEGRLIGVEGLSPVERAALATLYVALVADVDLDALGSAGTVVVDGPLAVNPLFPGLLQALRPACEILVAGGRAGAALAGRWLASGGGIASPPVSRALRFADPKLAAYRANWRQAAGMAQ